MDSRLRVSKIENVTCWRRGQRVEGTLHITSHHLIFSYEAPVPQAIGVEQPTKPIQRESWITYPMISHCIYRPAPPASHQPPSIRIRCRDFVFVSFHFLTDKEARDAYESIKSCTYKKGKFEKLYAFSYHPPPGSPEKGVNGWKIYDPRKEFARLGISEKNSDKGWRITDINKDYTYSPTYPAVLAVPSSISDNVLNYSVKFRSKLRIPALTYLHPINNCSITRSSQPMTGIRMNRNPQDEKLVAAIFATSKISITTFRSVPVTPVGSRSTSDLSETESLDTSFTLTENVEDEAIQAVASDETVEAPEGRRIYGAQQKNLIVDARPTVNAYAQQVTGAGSENMDFYRPATKVYLGIDNIHMMRKSLKEVVDTLKDSDITSFAPNRDHLAKSNWVGHIANMLDGAGLIARTIGINHSHVLIHCSDGWDRTSQLSALSQLCLDPYYRTLEGFIVLIEKDWLSFGHMFRKRCGHLNSEKWFEIENERVVTRQANLNSSSSGSGNAFENALTKAQGFFKKADKDSSESDPEASTDTSSSNPKDDKFATIPSETSPVFHQFLDATWQLMYQHPTRFQFNERFLKRLLYHLYSCQYGSFLFDSEKERVELDAKKKTRSVWDYFLSRRSEFMNPKYEPEIDDHVAGKERLIFPTKEAVRWWADIFGRTDAEMNGLAPGPSPLPADVDVPVVIGVESGDSAVGVGATTTRRSGTPQTNGRPNALAAGLASLGIGRTSSPSSSRARSPKGARDEKELEMRGPSPRPPTEEMETEERRPSPSPRPAKQEGKAPEQGPKSAKKEVEVLLDPRPTPPKGEAESLEPTEDEAHVEIPASTSSQVPAEDGMEVASPRSAEDYIEIGVRKPTTRHPLEDMEME